MTAYSEGDLTAGRAKAIISASFPQFRGMRVERLGEGRDFRVFEVEEELLFRFPKREKGALRLSMECKLLRDLWERLSLPVPRYEYFGVSPERSGWPFAGYKKIPGIPGDVAEAINRQSAARQLGTFLGELHAYPVDKAKEAGVPKEIDLVARWRDESLNELDRVADLEINLPDLRNYLENHVPPPFDGVPRLLHRDFLAEHVLIDRRTGDVSGIIDWADAVIGDPAVDFAGLYSWHGERWLKDVLTCYPEPVDSETISRARYLAACFAIHNIILGRALGHARWVKAAHAALEWVFAAK